MSFWEGFARAYEVADDKKTRAKEIEDAKALREKEYQRSRADSLADRKAAQGWQLQMFGVQQDAQTKRELEAVARRREEAVVAAAIANGTLLPSRGGSSSPTGSGPTASPRTTATGGSAKFGPALSWVKHTFMDAGEEGAGSELVALATQHPAIAQQLFDNEMDKRERANKEGLSYQTDPEAILANVSLYGLEYLNNGNTRGLTQEDIDAMDFNDIDDYYNAMASVSAAQSVDLLLVDKGSNVAVDTKGQNDFFDEGVLSAAQVRLDYLRDTQDDGENGEEFNDLNEAIKSYTEGGSGTLFLKGKFGPDVYKEMVGTGLFSNIEKNPYLLRYSTGPEKPDTALTDLTTPEPEVTEPDVGATEIPDIPEPEAKAREALGMGPDDGLRGPPAYKSNADLLSDIDSGKLKPGQKIILNGEEWRVPPEEEPSRIDEEDLLTRLDSGETGRRTKTWTKEEIESQTQGLTDFEVELFVKSLLSGGDNVPEDMIPRK